MMRWLAVADRCLNPASKVAGLLLIAAGGWRVSPELGLWLLGGGLVTMAVTDDVLDFLRSRRPS